MTPAPGLSHHDAEFGFPGTSPNLSVLLSLCLNFPNCNMGLVTGLAS